MYKSVKFTCYSNYQKHQGLSFQQNSSLSFHSLSVSRHSADQVPLMTWQFELKMNDNMKDMTKTSAQEWDFNEPHPDQSY